MLLQVGDLLVKKIPVHISVVGTPLIMQLAKVLLPGFPWTPAPAQPSAKLPSGALGKGNAAGLLQAEDVPAGMLLDFGQVLADTPAERTFHVFNTSSLPVQLDWTFQR